MIYNNLILFQISHQRSEVLFPSMPLHQDETVSTTVVWLEKRKKINYTSHYSLKIISITIIFTIGPLLLAFWPKIWEVVVTYELFFCHSMNAGSMVGIPWGGEDTRTLSDAKEFIWTYCIQSRWGLKNFGHEGLCSHPRAT